MKKISLFGASALLFCVLQTTTLNAKTYYISPSGNNSTGLTKANAWTGVSNIASTVVSGDTVLFEGNQTFTGNIAISSTNANNPSKPTVFSSYGTGRATIKTTTSVCGFKSTNAQGIAIKNLIFQGPNPAKYAKDIDGIMFYTTNTSGYLSNILVRNVEVSGFGFCGIRCYSNWAPSVGAGFKRVVIDSCSVHDCKENGIVTMAYDISNTTYQNYNVKVTNCKVYDITGYYAGNAHKGSGIVLSQVDSALIEKCVAYNTGTANSGCGGPGGIWVWAAKNVLIQFCESHHNSSGTTSGCDGLGFDLDGGVTNTTIQYCYSHDNDGAGYLLGNFSGARPWGSNTVRYCISVNDARSNNSSITLFTAAGTTWDGLKFYNNTVYSTPYSNQNSGTAQRYQSSAFQMSDWSSSTMTNIECYNNIFQTTSGVALINIPSSYVTATSPKFINNLYWTTGGAYKMTYGTPTYTSLATFRGTNREQLSSVNYGLNVDPLLTNVSSPAPTLYPATIETLDAYKITSNSPAKDAGLDLFTKFSINVGLRDYWNNISKTDAGYDIGAHEYTSTPTEVANNSVSSGLMIFPNPSFGEFGVMFDNQVGAEVKISITDISGKLVYETISKESLLKFGNLGLGTGVYFVSAKGQNVNATGKLIIK